MTDRLVEGYRRQGAAVDVAQEILAVLQMLGAVRRARREACVIVERLVVRREIGGAVGAGVDDFALFLGRATAIGEPLVPAAGIPGPADALRRQGVADRRRMLRRQRRVPGLVAGGVGEIGIAARRRRHPARLIGRLRRVDRVAVGRDLAADAAAVDIDGAVL